MKRAKKILITTESHETLILRISGGDRAYGHCDQCNAEVEMLSIDQAVALSGIRTIDLVRRFENNGIHGLETEMGHLLVCGESISKKDKRRAVSSDKF